jgi:hypothetical protein
MEKDEIDDVVCEILYQDGPDRHIDGHEVITSFILALLADEAEAWRERYVASKRQVRFL